MGERQFDQLTRDLAAGPSRRGVIRTGLGGLGAALVATLSRDSAEAKKCGRKKTKCGNKCCTKKTHKCCDDKRCCTKGRKCCDGRCCREGEVCRSQSFGKRKCVRVT